MKSPERINPSGAMKSWLDREQRARKSQRLLSGKGYKVRATPDGTFLDIEPGKGGGAPGGVPHILVCYNGTQVYLDEIDV